MLDHTYTLFGNAIRTHHNRTETSHVHFTWALKDEDLTTTRCPGSLPVDILWDLNAIYIPPPVHLEETAAGL